MAFNDNQSDNALPVGANQSKRASVDHLPKYFRTDSNKKFLSATLDQLLNPGVAEKISAYYGRRIAKARVASDNYIADDNVDRENYQFEPATLVQDELNNVTFYKDYNDFKNQIRAFNGTVENDSVLNKQEYYSWNPHINWDKFTNYREYYWLPNGPIGIGVAGQAKDIDSTFTVTSQDNLDNTAYVFSPDGKTQNPSLKLYRGQTYTFVLNTPGMPLTFRTARSLDAEVLYTTGVDDSTQTTDVGTITFEVDINAPDTLYYINGNDINTSGLIKIYDIVENSKIDVEAEIIGKQSYTMSNGHSLSNGMKVYFQGDVTPAKYAEGEWYVEGVGDKIKLVSDANVQIPGTYSTDKPVPFDSEAFDRVPFSNANSFAGTKDYVCMNRSSADLNPWSRYNRWTHKSVIEATATINGIVPEIDQANRAKRPIIEFNENIKLHEFGTEAKANVDLIDTFTSDVFSTIEGELGYNIDGVDVADGMRILFTGDPDTRVKGKIYKVNFITHNNVRQISLVEEADTTPLLNEVVLIEAGNTNKGKMWYYNGTKWCIAQEKTATNQTPMFDLFDTSGCTFSDTTKYPSTTFIGNKLFSYKQGTGTNDTELGFPLSYRALENTGDIEFDFNLLNTEHTYQQTNAVVTAKSDNGVLRQYSDRETFTYVSGWIKGNTESKQLVNRQYVVATQFNDFAIDVYDRSGDLNDLWVRVYVNDKRKLENIDYAINRINGVAYVTFTKDLVEDDIIVIKTNSATKKNANGIYEFPINYERNPKNENIESFTLGEVNDHVESITEFRDDWTGAFPGTSNLRDLGNLSPYGSRFTQHSGLTNLAVYHITDKTANVINALKYSRAEYGKFRRKFLQTAENLGYDGSTRIHFDKVITALNLNKTNDMPFYFSDMIGHGISNEIVHTVFSASQEYYSLTENFSLRSLSNQAISVYRNDALLCHGQDYEFEVGFEGFIKFLTPNAIDDVIKIYEYENTDGSYIPETPTKLGLYPAYVPTKFVDNTYGVDQTVIRGHDGSTFVAYDDFRDDLLLELEKRIYNNLKVPYNTSLFDIHDFVGGSSRSTGIPKWAIDKGMIAEFIDWLSVVGNPDYTNYDFYEATDSFTYNYSSTLGSNNTTNPGYWRAVYKQAFDTDRPHTHPWEMLGLSVKPTWWETEYGKAPYTSENILLWQDLEDGICRKPGAPAEYLEHYKRPGLTSWIPVDESGNLLSPVDANYAKEFVLGSTKNPFKFGDEGPTETAWRRSSEYPFALIISLMLNQPSRVLGLGWDRSRIVRDSAGTIVYSTTGKRLRLADLLFPNTSIDETRVNTCGLVNVVANYLNSKDVDVYTKYKQNVTAIDNKLGIKLGGFTEKSKFKLILDSRTPYNEGNVFVPEENYQIFLNTSSVTELVSYSGVIIEKKAEGFIIRGYDRVNPYFKYFTPTPKADDPIVTVGGISEDFVKWSENKTYAEGSIIQFGNEYYVAKSQHVAGTEFDQALYQKLPELPMKGGRSAFFRREFNTELIKEPAELLYGTMFRTVQEVVDFLLGYSMYLESEGFTFNKFSDKILDVENWRVSAKEFLFWTTQGWAENSVITLSPGANELKFYKEQNVADNIFDTFYEYSLLKADGKKLIPEYINVGRDNDNEFTVTTRNTADGIYNVNIPLVQKEHVVILDNTTVFKDVIYDQAPGYRQARLKVMGYRTDAWTGGFNIPGFIYDSAETTVWEQWKDYAVGDTVKYKEFYYVAKVKIPGTNIFDNKDWEKLEVRPEAGLKANLDYKAKQFGDFYDLDTDNFDNDQQRLAQHLIGYQKRKYLENIINDDVSQYKFYQGFIQDKGTKNSLTKLFDALSNTDADSLDFYEEWGFRLGQYGSSTAFDEVEYTLDEANFRLSPQPVELVDTVSGEETDLIYRIRPFETYLKPQGYNHKPFPTNDVQKNALPTAGYVNPQDVKLSVATYEDLLTESPSALNVGDYVWIGKKGIEWDVLKYIRSNDRVLAIQTSSVTGVEEFVITLGKQSAYEVDEIIGIVDVEGVEKFFKVKRNELDTLICYPNGTVEDAELLNGFVTKFNSNRTTSFDSANLLLSDYNNDLKVGETIWIDKDITDNWLVLKNEPVHSEQQVLSNIKTSDSSVEFGKVIAADQRNTTLAISAPGNSEVYLFGRTTDTADFTHLQTIEAPGDTYYAGNGNFGKSVAIAEDGEFLAIGAPQASNVKTLYKGEFSESSNYATNDIVSYQQNLWRANYAVTAASGSFTFNSYHASHDVAVATFADGVYPETVYAIRGRYSFDGATDHILVRAPADPYEGSAVNDKISLQWNQYSQNYPNGILPFGVNGPGVASFEGTKVIAGKIDAILYIDNILRTPAVGDIVSTPTAIGTVQDIIIDNVNSAMLYMTEVNGQFESSGSLITSSVDMGTYVAVEFENPNTAYGGWWRIDGINSFTTTEKTITVPNLVIGDYILSSESRTPEVAANTMDDVYAFNNDIGNPTKGGKIGILSHYDKQGLPVTEPYWFVRAPKAITDTLSPTDNFTMSMNQVKDSLNTIYDPSALGLSFNYINSPHTVHDLWDGYIDITFTNFTPPPNQVPYVPVEGDIVTQLFTGAYAEVAYVQAGLLGARVFVKNLNTSAGVFAYGNTHGATGDLHISNWQGQGFNRLTGRIESTDLSTDYSGKYIVVRNNDSTLLQVVTPSFKNEIEFQFYTNRSVTGAARTANIPSPLNKEYTQIYNLPIDPKDGVASAYSNEGAYFIYNKTGSGEYSLQHGYTNLERGNNKNLATQIEMTKQDNLYRLFVSAPGAGNGTNPGRIHFIKNGFDSDGEYDWAFTNDPSYKGVFSDTLPYYTNDIVLYNNQFYKSSTNQVASAFSSSWVLLAQNIDFIGYVPNDTGYQPDGDSTFDNEGNTLYNFAHPFTVSKNGNVLATVADFENATPKIAIYRFNNNHYEYAQVINTPVVSTKYASAIAISDDGELIAVGAPLDDTVANDNGKVYVYKNTEGTFNLFQELYSPDSSVAERFGQTVDFSGNELMISSQGGNLVDNTSFDRYTAAMDPQPQTYLDDSTLVTAQFVNSKESDLAVETTYDNNLTQFSKENLDSGEVFIYQYVGGYLLYAEKLAFNNSNVERFGEFIHASNNHIYVSMPELSASNTGNNFIGTVVDYKRQRNELPWQTYRSPTKQVNLDKFKGVFVYSKDGSGTATQLDYIDPIQGKIAGPAEEELAFTTPFDPATYTQTDQTSGVNVDTENYWANEHVGKLWWDISTVQWIEPYQNNIIYNTANFNQQMVGSSIDVYEWVETSLTPTQWLELADTEDGLARGISGTPKYGTATFVTKRLYNSVSASFYNKYYYWVKNTKIIPTLENRKSSAYDVAQLINDPAAQGYKFVAVYANDRFGLYNCGSLVEEDKKAINFRYWTIPNQEINQHNQYQLITDGLATSKPNKDLEAKWVDSLVGVDIYNRPVPDPALSPKQKYGILNRPRQSMFKNNTEALKQVIERTNRVLAQQLIVDEYNFTDLLSSDPQPDIISSKYDVAIDTHSELGFVNISKVKPATLTPVFEEGKLIRVDITNPGSGYLTVPTYEFEQIGDGEKAQVTLTLNTAGGIGSVTVRNPGRNYSANTNLSVRLFSVLVKSDETVNSKWSIFSYNTVLAEYQRTATQSYDVSNWWNYIDWYATGYSKFTDIDFTIDQSYLLTSLNDTIGDIVKIKNIGTGGWLLLEKISNEEASDYTTNYRTIGRENGTIEFKEELYNFTKSFVGFDGLSYDTAFYDNQPTNELRIILKALRDDIFVDGLEVEYNQLFLASVRYAFAEQPFVDWAFKTSFIKAKHNAGDLQQKVTFQNDNLPSYEEFVKETKPFKTKIREYLSNYTKTDLTASSTSDFDFAPQYNEDTQRIEPASLKVKDNLIYGQDATLNTYPNKHWLDNVGFEITNCNISDKGIGYTEIPVIKFVGGGGTGAKGLAKLGSGGSVVSIEVTNPGSGYLSAPTIEIEGSLSTVNESRIAKASAQIGNSKIRAMHLRSKFDRVTGTFLITSLAETQTFAGNNSRTLFDVKWPMDVRRNQVTITVNGIEELQGNYSVSNKEYTDKSYTRYKGRITFENPPVNNAVIVVTYKKDVSMLQAQDRINLFYNPTTGQLGNDISQLMDGVDYGGVQVKSFAFNTGTGYGNEPYYTTTWDSYDATYEDEIFQLDGSTQVLTLSAPLVNGVTYNVYKNGIRIDDPEYDGSTVPGNPNAVMNSLVGDGTTDTFVIDNDKIPTAGNDVIVIRKSTSDGSFLPDADAYDTMLQGGDIAYSTAKGISAEEIVVDGDGFVTPLTSKGPEELVPGQLLDSVNIKVYDRINDGSSIINNYNYIYTGSRTFNLDRVPASSKDVFVKANGTILDSGNNSLFTVNYQDKTLTLDDSVAIANGQSVNIITMSANGENILDADTFTGDGSTSVFVTSVKFKQGLSLFITKDGAPIDAVLAETDATYETSGQVLLRLPIAPLPGELIQYVIYDSAAKSFSQISIDEFTGSGSLQGFTLANAPFTQRPLANSVVVKVGNKILNPGYNQQYTVSSTREYKLRDWQVGLAQIPAEKIKVFLNGVEQILSTSYIWNRFNSSVELFAGVGNNGDILDVYLLGDGEYDFGKFDVNGYWVETPNQVQLTTAPQNGEKVTVYQFSNHDIAKIERINLDVVARATLTTDTTEYNEYHQLSNGFVKLRSPAIDTSYVWLTKNGELLSPNVEYTLLEDKVTIRVVVDIDANDELEVIHFSNSTIIPKFGFSQFKDMLNRTHFKRLGDDSRYFLAEDLNYYDTSIKVTNSDTLPQPNKERSIPGIVFVDGERIEYYLKEGGVLRQLRRGTLGTGIATVHAKGTELLDQSNKQTVPYQDRTLQQTFTADGSTSSIVVDFIPNSVHEFEIFVAGKRLRKNAINTYDPTVDLDSPEADIVSPAEFSVDGTTSTVVLAETPPINTKIVVVRRIGRPWTDTGIPLHRQENDIARFLRTTEVALPK